MSGGISADMDQAQLGASDSLYVAEYETEDGDGQTKRQRCEEVINPPRNHHRCIQIQTKYFYLKNTL